MMAASTIGLQKMLGLLVVNEKNLQILSVSLLDKFRTIVTNLVDPFIFSKKNNHQSKKITATLSTYVMSSYFFYWLIVHCYNEAGY
jgi:hypothetical protein